MTDIVRINSTPYSWTSCLFTLDLAPYIGFKDVTYEETRERKLVHVAKRNGKPVGITSGKYQVNGFTFQVLPDTWGIMTDYLTLKGLGSYGDATFAFGAQYIEPVPGAIPMTTLITGCQVVGVKSAHAEGTDELVKEISCMALDITENGKILWSLARSIP